MWCLIAQEFIDGDQSAICEWLMLLQILKKVVPVKWAEAAGGRLGVKTPNIKNIGLVVCTGQFHLDQRKMIGQHRIRAFFAAVAFFKAESHVHLVRFSVFIAELLALSIAEHLPAEKLCNLRHLIVQRTVSRHPGFVAIRAKRPPWNTDDAPLSKVLHEIVV